MNTGSLLLCLLVAITLFISESCTPARKAAADTGTRKLSTARIQEMLAGHNMPYDWFSGKARVTVEDNGTRIGGTVLIRMHKSRYIWMSIQKFGFEIARAYIRPDSAFVVDRFNKDYYAENLNDYLEAYHIPFGFEELQGLFLGNVPYTEGRRPKYRMESGLHYLTQVSPENLFFEYEVDSEARLRRVLVKDQMDRKVTSSLGEYVNSEGRDVPFRIDHVVESNNETLGMSIDYSSVEFDVEKNIPFEIPPHYTRIR